MSFFGMGGNEPFMGGNTHQNIGDGSSGSEFMTSNFSGALHPNEFLSTPGPIFGGEDFTGGAGFLQSNAGNFLTQANAPSSPQMSIIPVKIAQIQQAWKRDSTTLTLFPNGSVLQLVKVVGCVNGLSLAQFRDQLPNGHIRFFLEDFTGIIECELTISDEITQYKQHQLEESMTGPGLVSVFATINYLRRGDAALRVHAIRCVKSAAEFINFEASVQAAYLRLKYEVSERRV